MRPIQCVSREKEKLNTNDLINKCSHVTVTAGTMAVSVKATIHKATSETANTSLLCHLYSNFKTEKKAFYHKVP